MVAEFVTDIGKKKLCVLPAMLTKALARSETDRTIFVELPLHRTAAHVATEESVAAAFKPDLKWRRSVSAKRYEIDRPAKCQRAVFRCICASKDFCLTEGGNVKVLKNAFTIPLVEVKPSSKNITPSGSSSDMIPDPRMEILDASTPFSD